VVRLRSAPRMLLCIRLSSYRSRSGLGQAWVVNLADSVAFPHWGETEMRQVGHVTFLLPRLSSIGSIALTRRPDRGLHLLYVVRAPVAIVLNHGRVTSSWRTLTWLVGSPRCEARFSQIMDSACSCLNAQIARPAASGLMPSSAVKSLPLDFHEDLARIVGGRDIADAVRRRISDPPTPGLEC
jgi:hypothetical protein